MLLVHKEESDTARWTGRNEQDYLQPSCPMSEAVAL